MSTPQQGATIEPEIARHGLHEHLCSIYDNESEHFAVALPFIRTGLARGEKCVYVADEMRTDAMGEFTASIAHEVNQPLGAVVTNANACRRWLSGSPPDPAEAREAARRLVRDGRPTPAKS
jgi:signal transduction histidine kinase